MVVIERKQDEIKEKYKKTSKLLVIFIKKDGERIVIRALLITFYRYLIYKYSFVPIQYFIKKLKGAGATYKTVALFLHHVCFIVTSFQSSSRAKQWPFDDLIYSCGFNHVIISLIFNSPISPVLKRRQHSFLIWGSISSFQLYISTCSCKVILKPTF